MTLIPLLTSSLIPFVARKAQRILAPSESTRRDILRILRVDPARVVVCRLVTVAEVVAHGAKVYAVATFRPIRRIGVQRRLPLKDCAPRICRCPTFRRRMVVSNPDERGGCRCIAFVCRDCFSVTPEGTVARPQVRLAVAWVQPELVVRRRAAGWRRVS